MDNVKYDITMSPGKIEDYLEACEIVGDNAVLPTSYCSSRFLDRYDAVRDRIEHIDSLKEYYSKAKTPRSKVKNHVDSVEEATDETDDEEELTGNPTARVEFMKKALSDGNIIKTEVELLVSLNCLKSGFDFLKIFQGKEVKVHMLYEAL